MVQQIFQCLLSISKYRSSYVKSDYVRYILLPDHCQASRNQTLIRLQIIVISILRFRGINASYPTRVHPIYLMRPIYISQLTFPYNYCRKYSICRKPLFL